MNSVSSEEALQLHREGSDAGQPPVPEAIYIAWTVFQRRQVSMSELVQMECVFLPVAVGGSVRKVRAVCRYMGLMYRTVMLLRLRRPTVVWLQIPQIPLLWAALLYRALFDRNVKLVADCHNAMFSPRWSRVPFGLSKLGKCDLILVHNAAIRQVAEEMRLPMNRTAVLEDVPPAMPAAQDAVPAIFSGRPHPWILFPGSFSTDEPIGELLEAACLLDGGTVVITGRRENAAANGHDITNPPPNVVMPGYIDVEGFNALLSHCDIVLALTRSDGIQLSVCNEALGFGKPMVMSDTNVLRTIFADAAVMVRGGGPADIVAGILVAYQNMDKFSKASLLLAERRRREWLVEYCTIQKTLGM